MYRFCQILCFILKNCHNFKSYQNMLTFLVLVSCIKLELFLNDIYIASHLAENTIKRTKGCQGKSPFLGLHMTCEIFVLVSIFKLFFSKYPL